MIDPLLVFTPAIAPASGMFYSGSVFLQLKNNFLVGMLKGEGILRVSFDQGGQNIAYFEPLPAIAVGRVRDVIQGPDGLIYFATSNQDGRGKPQAGDDQIYRLVPIK
jgi:glucose/arabinose dehydrogenase